MIYGAGRLLRKGAGRNESFPQAFARDIAVRVGPGAGRRLRKGAGRNESFPQASARAIAARLAPGPAAFGGP